MKISQKLYTLIVVLSMILLSTLLIYLFERIYHVSRDNIINANSLEVSEHVVEIDSFLQHIILETKMVADMVDHMIDNGKSNEEILEYLIYESNVTSSVFEGNSTGIYGYIRGEYLDGVGWVPEADYDPTTRPWYIAAMLADGNAELIEPYIDAQTGAFLMSVAKLLDDKESVVSFDVYLDQMVEQVDYVSSTTSMQVIVITDEGLVVASSIRDEVGKRINDSDNEFIKELIEEQNRYSGNDYEFSYKGNKYTAFYKSMKGNWTTIMIQRSDDIMSSLKSLYIAFAVVFVFAIVGTLAIILAINNRRRNAEDLNNKLQSIADVYMSMYKLDFTKDEYELIKDDSYIRDLVKCASQKPYEMVNEVTKTIKISHDNNDFDLENGLNDINVLTYEFETEKGWIRERFIVIDRNNNKVNSALWVLENIDKEKKREENLVREVYIDELTSLANRKAFDSKIKFYEDKFLEEDLVCIVFDVNELKSTNDYLGHIAGDELLIGASKCLRKCFGEYGEIYRTGGDEFVAILVIDEETLETKKMMFEDTINNWKCKYAKKLSVSYGVAGVKEFPNMKLIELSKIADNRMYDYKSAYYKANGLKKR